MRPNAPGEETAEAHEGEEEGGKAGGDTRLTRTTSDQDLKVKSLKKNSR